MFFLASSFNLSRQEEYRLRAGGDDDVATRLVVTSGKMVLLDKLLKRLHATGHRWGVRVAMCCIARQCSMGLRKAVGLRCWTGSNQSAPDPMLPHAIAPAGCWCSARWCACWTSSAVGAGSFCSGAGSCSSFCEVRLAHTYSSGHQVSPSTTPP